MAVGALVLFTVWIVVVFGVRTFTLLRTTGDSGFRGVSRSSPVELAAGVGFVLALSAGVAAPVAALVGLDAIGPLSHGWVPVVGTIVTVVGSVATVLAQQAMGDSWRIGVDADEATTFVSEGAFRLVRNPVFSAMMVTALGLTLMVPNVLAVVGFVGLVATIQIQVRRIEEPHLRSLHGAAYRDYESRVGRFLPGIGRCSPPAGAVDSTT